MALLSIGSRGDEVKQLQGSLNLLPTNLIRLAVDGIFGPKTQSRVFEFQRNNFLSVDGIVGPTTLATIADILRKLGLLPGPTPTPSAVRPINQQILGMTSPNNLIPQIIPAKGRSTLPRFGRETCRTSIALPLTR
jgi:peptidoglycan hydrolase-like protein with peptidoglycan-binding domain